MDNSDFSNSGEEFHESLNIEKYVFLILRNWWLFAIAIFFSITTAYLVNRYSTDIYSVDCSIIIDKDENYTASIDNLLSEFTRIRNKQRKAIIDNEISILKSYKLTRLALEKLEFNID